MVAQQTLDLLVKVRILVRQPFPWLEILPKEISLWCLQAPARSSHIWRPVKSEGDSFAISERSRPLSSFTCLRVTSKSRNSRLQALLPF